MAQYHLSEEWLATYASGAADEQTAALAASHLTFCPACRESIARHEEVSGALFEVVHEDGVAPEIDVKGILNSTAPSETSIAQDPPWGTLGQIAPRPLVKYVYEKTGTTDLEALKWTFYGPGIKRAILVGNRENALVRLVKAQPGAKFPDHHHGSDELTLVLTGSYHDHTGHYSAGDVQCAPAAFSHQPIVDPEGVCFAFVVSEKPAVPKSLIARLAQRIIGT